MKLSKAMQSSLNYPLFYNKKRKVHGVTVLGACALSKNQQLPFITPFETFGKFQNTLIDWARVPIQSATLPYSRGRNGSFCNDNQVGRRVLIVMENEMMQPYSPSCMGC
jgi:hypothetical protein